MVAGARIGLQLTPTQVGTVIERSLNPLARAAAAAAYKICRQQINGKAATMPCAW
jgi:hypothetical protein